MTYQCTKFIQYGRGSLSNKRSQILVKMSTSTVFVFFFFLVGSKRRIAIHSLNKGYGKVKARDNPNNYEADCLFCLYNYNGFGHISRNLIK